MRTLVPQTVVSNGVAGFEYPGGLIQCDIPRTFAQVRATKRTPTSNWDPLLLNFSLKYLCKYSSFFIDIPYISGYAHVSQIPAGAGVVEHPGQRGRRAAC